MKVVASISSLLILGISTVVCAQRNATTAKAPGPLDYKLAEFEVKDLGLVDAVSQLSREPIKELHLGLEEVLRDKVSDATVRGPHFSFSIRNATARVIVDHLCKYDDRYTWSIDGTTINIYPKETTGDASYLLNRQLDRITVTEIPDPAEGLTFLDRQLPPPREQLAYAQAGGNFAYSAPWSEAFNSVTVRQYINRLSEHMGPHTSWVFYGSKQERLFTFLKGGFH
jgi:hypothetical protein